MILKGGLYPQSVQHHHHIQSTTIASTFIFYTSTASTSVSHPTNHHRTYSNNTRCETTQSNHTISSQIYLSNIPLRNIFPSTCLQSQSLSGPLWQPSLVRTPHPDVTRRSLTYMPGLSFTYTAVVARHEGNNIDAARTRWQNQMKRGNLAMSGGVTGLEGPFNG